MYTSLLSLPTFSTALFRGHACLLIFIPLGQIALSRHPLTRRTLAIHPRLKNSTVTYEHNLSRRGGVDHFLSARAECLTAQSGEFRRGVMASRAKSIHSGARSPLALLPFQREREREMARACIGIKAWMEARFTFLRLPPPREFLYLQRLIFLEVIPHAKSSTRETTAFQMYHRFMHHNSILLEEDREDSQILSFKKIPFFFSSLLFFKETGTNPNQLISSKTPFFTFPIVENVFKYTIFIIINCIYTYIYI